MTRSERAMQVWQILIGAAHNRQTLTYGQVAEHLEFEGAGVLAPILGCIMSYCEAKNLPPLTCLVVNKTTGLPGAGLTTVEDLPTEREAVYNQNWFAMYPVQIPDLESHA
ncbi:hypothetical protein [Methylophilus sp. 5]|uniref:hypothetical protein n=1 Tax=Methylophilus sp. 5 TaxID=1112274 RepID=UPI00048EB67D|nr:hypothetical protein [Methylophilus sp. 5]